MITPEDVKLQLMSALPRYTDIFGTNVVGTAVVESGVVKVTAVAHGLATDEVITASEVSVINPVVNTSFDSVADETTLTMTFEHDRTSGSAAGVYNKIEFVDFADANYNGDDFVVKFDTDRLTLVIDADADAVGDLGNQIEPRNLYLGFLTVTVVDVDTFTVPLEDVLPDGTVFDTFNFMSSQQIFISGDIARSVEAYKKHRDVPPGLFIVFGDEVASKDRAVVNDAVAANTAQNPQHVTYLLNVILLAFFKTAAEERAETTVQLLHDEVKPALRQAMFGHIFDDPDLVVQFAGTEIANREVTYNSGYYVHQFTYQLPYRISIEQGDIQRRNVSFRDLILNSTMFDSEGALLALSTEITV